MGSALYVLSGVFFGIALIAAVLYYFLGMLGVYIAPFVHLAICYFVTPAVERLRERLLNG